VQPAVPEAGVGEQPLPMHVVGVRVDRLTARSGEDVPRVPPELRRGDPLLLLLIAVPFEQRHQLDREPDGTPAGGGLGVVGLRPDVCRCGQKPG
jgi:hypothetical protein